MELNDLLIALDRTAANVGKLEQVWNRAQTFIPTGPARGSNVEYDDLVRAWSDLLKGIRPIDGWTITAALPDIDEVGQSYLDLWDIGEPVFGLAEEIEEPGRQLAEYRYRLNRVRRRAVRDRLEELSRVVTLGLPTRLRDVARDSQTVVVGGDVERIRAALAEIELLMGPIAQQSPSWSNLHRHLHFGQGHDWHDILEWDWPGVRPDVAAATFSETDPLEVPDIDLGAAASGTLTGSVSAALPWKLLTDDGFERLLYDLLLQFPEHQNVQWLMQTRAADRGRDLSMERVTHNQTASVRTERVIVQAKHWQSKSVSAADAAATVAGMSLWQPPVVRSLIIATSGRFSSDAVAWIERRNETGDSPFIEMWAESHLEMLLAQKPEVAAAHGLR